MTPAAGPENNKTLLYLLLFFLLLINTAGAFGTDKNQIKSVLPPDYSCDLIIVPETCEWLLPLVSPIVTITGTKERMPYLLTVSGADEFKGINLIRKIAPGRILNITTGREAVIDYEDIDHKTDTLFLEKSEYAAGIMLARFFFSRTGTIICVPENEPDAKILGAMIACRLKCPLIPVPAKYDSKPLISLVNDNKVKNIIWISVPGTGMKRTMMPESISSLKPAKTGLYGDEVYDYFFKLTKKEELKNIIAARIYPADKIPQAAPFWVTPYLSLLRNSCIVLSGTGAVPDIEEKVFSLIRKYGLNPRSITITGDKGEIKTTFGDAIPELNKLKVEFEPCALPNKKKALAFEVGRLPFRTSVESLNLIAQTLMHELPRNIAHQKILMFSNPLTTYPALPLCETISRAACAEFRNAGILVNEFYSMKPYEAVLFERAEQATMIIYQGHIFDLILFNDNSNYYFDEYMEKADAYISDADAGTGNIGYDTIFPADDTGDDSGKLHSRRLPTVRELSGFPFVLLQSCRSLDWEIAKKVFALGGAGIIGSNSSINSASGSAFIKVFCDALIYKQCTVGEALRDARNYTLCLIDLKDRRKHSEQDKVKRAAYSFQLWGDPEFTPFPKNKSIKIQPSSARFVSPDTITINTAEKLLPVSTTEKYSLTLLPGMEAAGIVKRIKNKSRRNIVPFFYFRLPIPVGFIDKPNLVLKDDRDETARAVYRIDPVNNVMYIVYYPEKAAAEKKHTLIFFVDKNLTVKEE